MVTKKTPAKKKARSAEPVEHRPSDAGTELDGCDLKLEQAEATPDEDLPAAEGGVA